MLLKTKPVYSSDSTERSRDEKNDNDLDPMNIEDTNDEPEYSPPPQTIHAMFKREMEKNLKNQSEDLKKNLDFEEVNKKLSNKDKKLLARPSLYTLKSSVRRSDLVEEHDVNSPDPFFLVRLKSVRNTVPVPSHWSSKQKFLQSKRGYLKPMYKLPHFIESTGIGKMRDNSLLYYGVNGADANGLNNSFHEKTLKQQQRDRMRPKNIGSIEIDYNKLMDAFFHNVTKPLYLSKYGELYFEGKEHIKKYRQFYPGHISDDLKKALGMTARYRVISPTGVQVEAKFFSDSDGKTTQSEENGVGMGKWKPVTTLKYGTYVVWDRDDYSGIRIKISSPVIGWCLLKSEKSKKMNFKRVELEEPPPWLTHMQRFGPPPSYPYLKIPGLNSPIPPGKAYGFNEGQWGKPPVDENGMPVYGNPYGIWTEKLLDSNNDNLIWGKIKQIDNKKEEGSDDEDESSQNESVKDVDDKDKQNNEQKDNQTQDK